MPRWYIAHENFLFTVSTHILHFNFLNTSSPSAKCGLISKTLVVSRTTILREGRSILIIEGLQFAFWCNLLQVVGFIEICIAWGKSQFGSGDCISIKPSDRVIQRKNWSSGPSYLTGIHVHQRPPKSRERRVVGTIRDVWTVGLKYPSMP